MLEATKEKIVITKLAKNLTNKIPCTPFSKLCVRIPQNKEMSI